MADKGKEQEQTKGKSNSDQGMKAAFTYLVGWVTGLVMLFVEKKDDYVRFHAAQSVIVFGLLTIVSYFPYAYSYNWVIQLAGVVLWLVLMVKAYQGERFKLPVVGDLAESLKDKVGK